MQGNIDSTKGSTGNFQLLSLSKFEVSVKRMTAVYEYIIAGGGTAGLSSPTPSSMASCVES
jgi:hypothetical protein